MGFEDITTEEEKGKAKKSIWNSWAVNVILFVFIAVLAVTGYLLLHYYLASRHNDEINDTLKDLITTEEEKPDEATLIGKIEKQEFVEVDGVRVLKKFSEIYKRNKDFIGWVSIKGTHIDCPVMYTPDNEEKYLRKDFNGDYALAGEPFLSKDSDPRRPSTNMIIYGHNMYDRSMFADLMEYKDPAFYEGHKYIRFDTIYGTNEYEIIAVFGHTISNQKMQYFDFQNAWDVSEYNEFISQIKGKSIISTSLTATYEEKLLTLSTCEEQGYDNGKRFVVVAKRIGE